MRMGFIAEMEPLEMRALYNKLFIEFIQQADDKIMERVGKAVSKPPNLAI